MSDTATRSGGRGRRSRGGEDDDPAHTPPKRARREQNFGDDDGGDLDHADHDGRRAPVTSGRRGGRRGGRPSYSLTQPDPSGGDDEIEILVGDDQPDDDGDAVPDSRGHRLSAASPSSSGSPTPEPPALNSDVLAWLKSVDEMAARRRITPLVHQSKRDRIHVRSMYEVLQNQTATDPNVQTEEGIRKGVLLIDRMNKAVAHVTEEIQDAEELRALASKGAEKAKAQLQGDSSFDLRGQHKPWLPTHCLSFAARV